MKTKFAGGLICLSGLGLIAFSPAAFTPQDTVKPAFPEPRLMASTLCGQDGSWLKRRAFFADLGRAYAQDAPVKAENTALPPETVKAFNLPITNSAPDAQTWFDTGLSHVANFNHGEAVEAFRKAQAADPNCAMCFWGEAFALGGNINAPFNADNGKLALEAIQAAALLTEHVSDFEKAMISALEKRYILNAQNIVTEDGATFADAMDAVAKAYPDNDFALILAAEANMDTQPWYYWETDGLRPRGRTARTIELIETVLKRNPEFAPAIHLYIHITEASNDPYRAEGYADRLAKQDLSLSHLIHMPSHTYFRIGRWKKSLNANIAAVATDEAYLTSGSASDSYKYGYYPHNIHFAMTTALMAGKGDVALDMAEKLKTALPMTGDTPEPYGEWMAASYYQIALHFMSPDEVLALPKPKDTHPFLTASWHYARGEAFALLGEADKAMAEAKSVETFANSDEIAAFDAASIPGADILKTAALTVKARSAAAGGDLKAAISFMELAVIAQNKIPYTEPPFWYYPSRQTLAALVLQDGQFDRAEALFYETLVETPNNAYALYGLYQTFKAQKKDASAAYAKKLFDEAWMGGEDSTPDPKLI